MRKFNVNLSVKVKLTEHGIAELKRQHDELNQVTGGKLREFKAPAADSDGLSTFQLYDLMYRFGHMFEICNTELPFEHNNIFIPHEPAEQSNG